MTGNFTASSQKTDPILLRVRESTRFALAGTWTGTIVLERSESGIDGWKILRVLQSNVDSSTRNIEDKSYWLRLRSVNFDSGVCNYTLEDVVGDKIWREVLPDGTEVISVTDDGNLYVRGALFSGGGGGGTPGGLDTSIQYNNGGAFDGFGSWDGTNFLLPGFLALQEPGGSGAVKQRSADFTSDYTIIWPEQGPTADNQTLVYDGAGNFFWEQPTVPDFVGDSGSGGTAGLVPAPATGDATKYLRGDATWATVSAGVTGPGSSTDRGISTWNGTGAAALRDNPTTIDSSGDLHGNRDLAIYGGASDTNRIKITDAVIGFHFNTGIPLQSFDGGNFYTYYPDHQCVFGSGAGTGGTFYFIGASTNGFNSAINGIYGAGNNTGANQGGYVHLRPGTSSSGDDGYALLGLASIAAADNGGFPYMPTISGTPSGTPTSVTGFCPFAFEVSTNKLWMYNGSAWKSVTLT